MHAKPSKNKSTIVRPSQALALRLTLSLALMLGQAALQPAAAQATAAKPASTTQFAPDRASFRADIDRIMALIGAGKLEQAIAQIKPRTVVPEVEVDAMLSKITPQLPMMIERYGRIQGQEFISEKTAGQHLVRLIYLTRHERNAVVWVFVGYGGAEGWSINSFNFMDNPAMALID